MSYHILVINCLCTSIHDLESNEKFKEIIGENITYTIYSLAGCCLCYGDKDFNLFSTFSALFNNWKFSIMSHIDIAIHYYDTKKVIIIEHENCKLYKQHYDIFDKNTQNKFNKLNANTCKEEFNNKIKVDCYILKENNEIIPI